MSYSIQFLDDQAFESLPGDDMASKVGIAYPESGQAFVRNTGIPTLDVFTAIHELEHLKGDDLDEHFDSENKCYYKKISDILPYAAPLAFLIPGVGPALGGALSSIGGGVASGLGAISPALGGAAQSIGGGIGSMLGIGGGAGAVGSAAADRSLLQASASPGGFASRVRGVSQAPNIFGSAGSALKGFGNSAAKGAASQFGSNLAGDMFGGGQMMEQFGMDQEQGSYNPQTFQSPNANVIPGQSGEGSQGGPGGSPGGVGGGAVSKLKQYLQQQGGNEGNAPGGMF